MLRLARAALRLRTSHHTTSSFRRLRPSTASILHFARALSPPPEPLSSTTAGWMMIGAGAAKRFLLPFVEQTAKSVIERWTESEDPVALQILKHAVLPPLPASSERLKAIGLLPRPNEAELQTALESPGTTCLVGPSGAGKSFFISSYTRALRNAALRAQGQAGSIDVPDHVNSIPEAITYLDATQAPFNLYVSLRGMPRSVDDLGEFILRSLGASKDLAKGQRIFTLGSDLKSVLRVLHARTGRLPFVIIDDAQRIFELDSKDPVRIAMEDLVLLLHDVAYLEQSVRLVLIMSSDETEGLKRLSGMPERLRLIRSGYIDMNEHRQTLQDKLGLTPSEVEAIIGTVGGNIGDLDKVLEFRASMGVPAALANLVKISADSMIDFIKRDPAPQVAWQLLQHLCARGRIDMAGATAQLGVEPVDPEHVIRRLVVANLSRKQDTNLYLPYKPAQRKAWAQVECDDGVQQGVGKVKPLAPCSK